MNSQHLQLPNIRLEPWRCCCWQCYRLPAVEGGARFLVKPFIKLSAWKPFELANFKLFSKVSKLKDQRNCELVSILFFLPNGTMSRFKRPQPVAPPGCGPGFRFKGFEAPAETFWWTNVSQNAGQRAAEMIVQASREAWKGTDCQAVPKSRNLSFESVKFVQIKNVRTWFEEKKAFQNQWQQIPKVWKQSDITVTLNHQSCLHSLAKRSAAFNGCLPSTCPNKWWVNRVANHRLNSLW